MHTLLKLWFFVYSILFPVFNFNFFFFLPEKPLLALHFVLFLLFIVLLLDIKIWVAGLRRRGTRTHFPDCSPMCSFNPIVHEGSMCALGGAIKGSKKSRAKGPRRPSSKENSWKQQCGLSSCVPFSRTTL